MFVRFDVSKFCNIPLDSDALKSVLANLPSDADWDKSNPLEKAMFEAGEPRYCMDGLKKSFKRTYEEEFIGEKTTSSKERKSKSKEAVQPQVKVKMEHPQMVSLRQKLNVMKSGKGAFL